MTHAQLTVVSGRPSTADESFKDQIDDIGTERKEKLIEAVQKWIVFWASFGAEKLWLDEFPVALSQNDLKMVVEYLKDQNFAVEHLRLSRRLFLRLET